MSSDDSGCKGIGRAESVGCDADCLLFEEWEDLDPPAFGDSVGVDRQIRATASGSGQRVQACSDKPNSRVFGQFSTV